MDYILGGEAIAKRVVSEVIFADGTADAGVTTKYLHRNHLSQIIDPDEYDIKAGAESMHGKPYASGGDDQFQGHKDDPETGLHYNIARSYSPMIARWTTPDPLRGSAYVPQSLNKYAYNMNDPVNLVDGGGKCSSFVPFYDAYGWMNGMFDWNYQFFYNSLMNSGNSEAAMALAGNYMNMCGAYYEATNGGYGYPSGGGGGGGGSSSGGGGGSSSGGISSGGVNTGSGNSGNVQSPARTYDRTNVFSTIRDWLDRASNCGSWIYGLFQYTWANSEARWNNLSIDVGQGWQGFTGYIVENSSQYYSGNPDVVATEQGGIITLWRPFFEGNETFQAQFLLHELIHRNGAISDIDIAKYVGGWDGVSSASAYWHATLSSRCN